MEAVQHTLAKVCADYPLDYSMLRAKYQDDVVQACCRAAFDDGAGSGVPRCSGVTKAGKPCGRRAVINGVCTQHLEAKREEQAAARRQEAYAASLTAVGPRDPHAHELRSLGTKHTVSMAFPDADAIKRSV